MSRSTVACGHAVSEAEGQKRGLGFASFAGWRALLGISECVWRAPIKRSEGVSQFGSWEARYRSLASIDDLA